MDAEGRASFAEQLAALRDQAGLSLADVAAAAHVTRGYVHHIEHGHRWPTQHVALAARHPRRVDAATVCVLANVLAATRRLEDPIGSAAVLPGVRGNRALARSLLADARGPIRDRAGALAGELQKNNEYAGHVVRHEGAQWCHCGWRRPRAELVNNKVTS